MKRKPEFGRKNDLFYSLLMAAMFAVVVSTVLLGVLGDVSQDDRQASGTAVTAAAPV